MNVIQHKPLLHIPKLNDSYIDDLNFGIINDNYYLNNDNLEEIICEYFINLKKPLELNDINTLKEFYNKINSSYTFEEDS